VEPIGEVGEDPAAKRHLIILVNGLFGSADNWDVVVECLQVPAGHRVNCRSISSEGLDDSVRRTTQRRALCMPQLVGHRLAARLDALAVATRF